ncbi:hypothetical protein FHS43_000830 [Streptosporangium becharense]|uniref:Uncharacterized protein n=1 Tax=Streptosporangium becharense TaxID=1816182 RepID=A0A7W9MG40_9ACTN|nr:hypothetical protein [Streptosporangium becharense]MBB2909584.1 hypothetical protein [Streptosporangium becharense]MBB5819460.1 hypothetical protein [Streptosporangium becharense]
MSRHPAAQRPGEDPGEDGVPMSLLEKRYRAWLRLLPASYRAEREEEMVSAFLEGSPGASDEHNPRPRWAEVASVAALAVRVRLGGAGAAPRFRSWGEAVRLAALLGLFFQAALSVQAVETLLRVYGVIGVPDPALAQVLGAPGSFDRLVDVLGDLSGTLWTLPFAALVLGRVRAARGLSLLAFAPDVYVLADALRWGGVTAGLVTRMAMPALVLLALWAGFHRDAPAVRRSPWMLAWPLAAGAGIVALLRLASPSPDTSAWWWPWLHVSGLASALILSVGAACLYVHARVPARRTPSWPLALAILAVPVLGDRLSAVQFDVADETGRIITTVALVQAAALLALAVALAVVGVRTLPAAPPVTSTPRESGA